MKNRTKIEDFNSETCPEHGSDITKEYDFGMYDATVSTFDNCNCAVVTRDWPMGSIYCTTYNEAEGIARLEAARMSN